MSGVTQFLALAAIELAGLFAIWLVLKAKVRRYLELDNLLAGVRDEARALVLELNETADRNVSLVEDRMIALRELLAEVDRRIGVEKRELVTRDAEREVYAKLSRRRPIVPEAARSIVSEAARPIVPEVARSIVSEAARPIIQGVSPPEEESAPITLSLGSEAQAPQRSLPEVRVTGEINAGRSRREEALDLYRRGISADLIAARLGATVAEIELLIEIEERRREGAGGFS
jgi:vacuolar-type H+-ATPase subunit H